MDSRYFTQLSIDSDYPRYSNPLVIPRDLDDMREFVEHYRAIVHEKCKADAAYFCISCGKELDLTQPGWICRDVYECFPVKEWAYNRLMIGHETCP